MIIGVDLDDVLMDFFGPFLEFYNKKNGTNYRKEQITSYDFWELLGVTRERVIEEVHAFYKTPEFMKILPLDGAINGINSLEVGGNKLIIVTGRPEYEREISEEWIGQHFPGRFSSFYFTNNFSKNGIPPRRKAEVCLKQNIPILLEDSLKTATDCATNGVKVFLFDRPWNQIESLPKGVVRVKSWEELLELLKKIQ